MPTLRPRSATSEGQPKGERLPPTRRWCVDACAQEQVEFGHVYRPQDDLGTALPVYRCRVADVDAGFLGTSPDRRVQDRGRPRRGLARRVDGELVEPLGG